VGKPGLTSKVIGKIPEKEEQDKKSKKHDRGNGAVIDAPWTYHAPKLIIW